MAKSSEDDGRGRMIALISTYHGLLQCIIVNNGILLYFTVAQAYSMLW